ncbi:MAG TPA: hypothetical protein VIV65_00785 [Gemmatimonadaceae bacterium]|jgi:hypothetical protein
MKGRAVKVMMLVLLPAAAAIGQRKTAGDGYLFREPNGMVTLRLGYDLASASGDVYSVQRRDLTIGSRGFDGLNWGVDAAFDVGRRWDLGLTVDGNTRSRASEYRDWQDNSGQPINQRTTLSSTGLSANLRYNLVDRGRSISNFAWIPAGLVPYIGGGVGLQYYELIQSGDFIDFSSANKDVVNDRLTSDGFGLATQAFGGFLKTLTPHVALTTEARYTFSRADLNQDYRDLRSIDLSGLALTIGTSIRF